jgi:dethiobiotin synthetase
MSGVFFQQMGRRFLITGTEPRVGKTTVGCALGFAMRARGMRVGVMKPVDTLESQDAQALALAVGSSFPVDVICPCRGSEEIGELSRIRRCFDEIASQSDVVLVEGGSTTESTNLAAMLGLEVILVVGNRSGCVDAMRVTLRHCERSRIKVAGCILSDCEVGVEPNVDALDTPPDVAYLGRMRHREPLARAIVEKLV